MKPPAGTGYARAWEEAIREAANVVSEIPCSASLYESPRVAQAVLQFKEHAIEVIRKLQ